MMIKFILLSFYLYSSIIGNLDQSVCQQGNITVHVATNGTNKPECLLENESCRTLLYIFQILHENSCSGMHLLILVSSNETQIVQGTFYLHNMNLTVKGTYANSKPLIYMGRPVGQQTYLRNLRLLHLEDLRVRTDLLTITYYQSVKFVSFRGCVIEYGQLWITGAHDIHFSSCILESVALQIDNVNNTAFEYCKFQSISFNSNDYSCGYTEMSFIFKRSISTSFKSCKFLSLTIFNPYLIVFEHGVEELQIVNCLFREITGGGILHVFGDKNEVSNCALSIKNTLFSNNSNTPFDLLTIKTDVKELIFDNCTFKETTGNILEFWGEQQTIISTIKIQNSIFSKNINYDSSHLIRFAWEFGNPAHNVHIGIINSSFNNNRLTLMFKSYETSIIDITDSSFEDISDIQVNIENVTFQNNLGTGLFLSSVRASLVNVNFINNTGLFGSGMNLQSSKLKIKEIFFRENTVVYGGVIFVIGHCSEFFPNSSNQMYFSENHAIANIYVDDNHCARTLMENLAIENDTNNLISGPNFLKFNEDNAPLHVFPGQNLVFPVTVVDFQGHNATSCVAMLTLECTNRQHLKCKNGNTTFLKLIVDSQLFLRTTDKYRSGLYLTSTQEFFEIEESIRLKVTCGKTLISNYIYVHLERCPLGFVFSSVDVSNADGTCNCVQDHNIQCDVDQGIACIRRGYWYGAMRINGTVVNTTLLCSHPYCTQGDPCPIDGYRDMFVKLPTTQDEQCSNLYGGFICRSCQKKAVFTFGAGRCISLSKCTGWMPYAILSIAIAFQVIVIVFIIIFLKSNVKSGVGYLYGPLFFLAVYELLPVSSQNLYIPLEMIISIYHSVFFLNMSVFGKIPWCFFPNIDPILNYSLRFVGPLVTFAVLLLVIFITRHFYRTTSKFLASPIQAMCLLIVLSFWSVSNTCIEIIKPFITEQGWRVGIEPDQKYLHNGFFIVFWILSLLLMLLVYMPFIFLLFFSQCLRAKMNLIRIQPFLDAFQSSYREKFQWYAGVYLFSWVMLNINVNVPTYVFEAILISVCLMHFIVQPHKNRWLNVLDTLLLSNLIFLASFTSENDKAFQLQVLVEPFVNVYAFIPLLIITIGGFWFTFGNFCVNRLKARFLKCANTANIESENLIMTAADGAIDREESPIPHENVGITVIDPFREPLIFEENH